MIWFIVEFDLTLVELILSCSKDDLTLSRPKCVELSLTCSISSLSNNLIFFSIVFLVMFNVVLVIS